ncbi:proton-coupled amino acid transporter-like protein pathetic isoform X2 [Ischnura elegans]|uniref:proton-coupled amino acid transporter-like protein pathetic isoform X2 n=1 Tax=Ischnura elegans TaxID=197161 RepID=UPI001ED887F8|nr:proton-coupled amino acid transporter-like protein pathetic isoform X2 [Ischnura elegans]
MDENHATELQTFLPQDGKITIVPTSGEAKASERKSLANDDLGGRFNPFTSRQTPIKSRTTDTETLIHILKASVGTGILGMPYAFMNAGLSVGIFGTVLIALICTHCAYVLVKCAHELYYRHQIPMLTFAGIGETAFTRGPESMRKYARLCKLTVMTMLFLTYFGTLCVYSVIVGNSIQQVIEHYTESAMDPRIYIAALLVPLMFLGFTPNLKMLAPVSLVANLCMVVGLGITAYYLLQDQSALEYTPLIAPLSGLPQFFSITVFAMEAIGVMMPLENSMKNPPHFLRIWNICGVLNIGMTFVTIVYAAIGFIGYVRYGELTQGAITLNLPTEEGLAQTVKIMVAVAVFCTYGLQFFVCLEIAWGSLKEKFADRPLMGECIVRASLVVASIIIAVAVPTIGPFMGLIGALCFSVLGIVLPAIIETVMYWDKPSFIPYYENADEFSLPLDFKPKDGHGLGYGKWVLYKNIFILIFGFCGICTGSYTSVLNIIEEYTTKES